jgi:hypothetical protein
VIDRFRASTFNRRTLVQTGAEASAFGLPLGGRSAVAAMRQDETRVAGGTLTIGQDFGPQSLDPATQTAGASTNVEELI